MRYSTIWVYQEFAVKLGADGERDYLQQIQYGNMDPSGDVQQFWLSGALRVSAMEQVEFLQRLYHNALSFSLADQRLVKDLMVNEAGQEWFLRARSGWAAVAEQTCHRLVGWLG